MYWGLSAKLSQRRCTKLTRSGAIRTGKNICPRRNLPLASWREGISRRYVTERGEDYGGLGWSVMPPLFKKAVTDDTCDMFFGLFLYSFVRIGVIWK